MELLAIIFTLWVIGCLFPGEHNGGGLTLAEIGGYAATAGVLIVLFVAWGYSVAGIIAIGDSFNFGAWIIPVAILGPIVLPFLICGVALGAGWERKN